MEFPSTNKEEDNIAEEESFRIVEDLIKKYSNNNIRDLDIILNTLCACLVRIAYLNCGKNNYGKFSELCKQVIDTNLSKF